MSWFEFFGTIEPPKKTNELEHLIRIPQVRQPNTYSCGVACLQSVLYYYGKEVDYSELEKATKTSKINGADHRDIIKYLQEQGLKVELHKGMLLSDLMLFIDREMPVIVVLQAWSEKSQDYEKNWDSGHYAVIVGYDEDNVYFMDPSSLGHYAYIPINEFIKRWHDKDGDVYLRQAGIVISGKKTYDADKIVKLR